MDVKELRRRMDIFVKQGLGDTLVRAWDPDSEEYQAISGFVYHGNPKIPIDIQTDDPDYDYG